MPIPTTKAELLDAIIERFAKLDRVLDTVPVDLADKKSMDGHAKGTRMSPNDLVSYLIGWNALVSKWLELDRNGKVIDFPEVGYKWNQLGELAQKFYDDYSEHTFEENRSHLERYPFMLHRILQQRSSWHISVA